MSKREIISLESSKKLIAIFMFLHLHYSHRVKQQLTNSVRIPGILQDHRTQLYYRKTGPADHTPCTTGP